MSIKSILAIAEIKCPENPDNHVSYCDVTDGEALKEIFPETWYQMQFGMACLAKEWGVSFMDMQGIFVSYCPIVNEPYKQFHTAVIEPDYDFYCNLEPVIQKSEAELKTRVIKMKIK